MSEMPTMTTWAGTGICWEVVARPSIRETLRILCTLNVSTVQQTATMLSVIKHKVNHSLEPSPPGMKP
jgi:hypothetical protein